MGTDTHEQSRMNIYTYDPNLWVGGRWDVVGAVVVGAGQEGGEEAGDTHGGRRLLLLPLLDHRRPLNPPETLLWGLKKK